MGDMESWPYDLSRLEGRLKMYFEESLCWALYFNLGDMRSIKEKRYIGDGVGILRMEMTAPLDKGRLEAMKGVKIKDQRPLGFLGLLYEAEILEVKKLASREIEIKVLIKEPPI